MAVTVPFDEDSGSPTRENWTRDGAFAATRILRCDWDDRHTLARQLQGFIAGAFAQPDTYPGVPVAFVQAVSIAPFGDLVQSDSGLNEYEKAVLTVEYSTPQMAGGVESGGVVEDDGVIVEESLEPSVELLTMSGTRLFWDAGQTTPVEDVEAPGLVVRLMDWSLSIRNVTTVPVGLDDHIGKVNSQQITSRSLDNRVFPAETLLFMGASQSRSWTVDGPTGWNIAFKFQYRKSGWNQFFRSGATAAASLYDASGNVFRPFETLNFVTTFNLRVG